MLKTTVKDFIVSFSEKIPYSDADFQEDPPFTRPQNVVSRFMNAETNLMSLLLIHEMGTGKTCTAAKIIEGSISLGNDRRFNAISVNNTMTRVYYIIQAQKHEDLIRSQMLNVCCPFQFRDIEAPAKEELFKKYVHIITSTSLNKILETNSRETLKMLENSLFIFDEVHNFKSSTLRRISNVFKTVKNKKLLLMSGTPMRDSETEIIPLLNFMRESFNENPLPLSMTPVESVIKMSRHISYLKATTDVVPVFKTNHDDNKLVSLLTMKKGTVQERVYLDLLKKASVENSKSAIDLKTILVENPDALSAKQAFYNDVFQAGSYVFPDGSVGRIGFDKYISVNDGVPQFRKGMKKEFDPQTQGVKFFEAMNILNAAHHNGECSFVYSSYVNGSGILLFSLILETSGFVAATNPDRVLGNPQKRFLLITSKSSNTDKLLQIYNSAENVNGKYISCVIGSIAMSEGYSLNHVRNVIILNPVWNKSTLYQIIYRGIRFKSHDRVKQTVSDWSRRVNVYLLAATVKDDKIFDFSARQTSSLNLTYTYDGDQYVSFDAAVYNRIEEKDMAIQNVLYAAKINARDCNALHSINKRDSQYDGFRECENQKCDYACQSISDVGNAENAFLLSGRSRIDDFIKAIVKFFKEKNLEIDADNEFNTLQTFCITTYELFQTISQGRGQDPKGLQHDFKTALSTVINTQLDVGTFLGQPRYLEERDDMIYTTHDFLPCDPRSGSYYDISSTTQFGFPEMSMLAQIDTIKAKLATFIPLDPNRYEEYRDQVTRNLSHEDVYTYFVHFFQEKDHASIMRDLWSDYNKDFFDYLSPAYITEQSNDQFFITCFLKENDVIQRLVNRKHSSWYSLNRDHPTVKHYFEEKTKRIQALIDKAKIYFKDSWKDGFFGLRSVSTSGFCIRFIHPKRENGEEVEIVRVDADEADEAGESTTAENKKSKTEDLRTKNVGQKIDTITAPKLRDLFKLLFPDHAEAAEYMNKSELIQPIKNHLLRHGLFDYDQSCGTQNKSRR
jgi:hypothetical protein